MVLDDWLSMLCLFKCVFFFVIYFSYVNVFDWMKAFTTDFNQSKEKGSKNNFKLLIYDDEVKMGKGN